MFHERDVLKIGSFFRTQVLEAVA